MTVHTKRPIKANELLAIMPDALQGRPGAMYWDSYVNVPYNARVGSVAIVSIRGALDHHPGYGCDSYDSIIRRLAMALVGEDDRPRWMRENYDAPTPPMEPPSAVVLRIDSPGGAVSGLNECVFALRRMSEAAGIPLIGYADELAASAAYAIACACEELILPPSAIVGSIGVISTLFDQTAADEKMGVNVVTITSGARKADGHPHVAVSEAAIAAEQSRVDTMAMQFYRIVADARELPVATIRGFEAGIFLGEEAVEAGVADAVMGFDALLQLLDSDAYKQNVVAERAESASTSNAKAETTAMGKIAMTNQIARLEAALKIETDPTQKKAITAAIASAKAADAALTASKEAMKKTKIKYEETTSEETPEEKAAKEKAKAEKEAKEAAAETDDGDDPEDPEDDDDDDTSKAALALLAVAERVTGRRGARAVAALESRVDRFAATEERLAKLEKEGRDSAKESSITAALSARRITPHEATTLRGKKASYVAEYIGDRKGQVVHSTDDETTVIRAAAGGSSEDVLPPEAEEQIAMAMRGLGNQTQESRAKIEADLRAAHLANHKKRMQAGLNGASGRI